MTDLASGIPIFEFVGPEAIGSINLVLSCLANSSMDSEPAVDTLLMMSGISGPLVNPRSCFDFTTKLGIVIESHDRVRLSRLGEDLLADASWPPFNLLSRAQGKRLLVELVNRPDFADPLSSLIRKMRRRQDGMLELVPGSVHLSSAETQCLHALQSLHAMHYQGGVLVMEAMSKSTIMEHIGQAAAVTEDELLVILEHQRLRAVAAEEYVIQLEVNRLTRAGRSDLASLVERVAKRDVAAGYDVRSFEENGSDKYIEVKSSTSSTVRFFLSRNELQFLKAHDSESWIYFVPRVHELPNLTLPILAIRSPSQWIEAIGNVEATEYLVELPDTLVPSTPIHDGVLWLAPASPEGSS